MERKGENGRGGRAEEVQVLKARENIEMRNREVWLSMRMSQTPLWVAKIIDKTRCQIMKLRLQSFIALVNSE